MLTLTRLRDESGTALVEFALVLPLVLAIFLGMLDFGRAIHYWIDGTHIANVGARFATVNKNPGAPAGKSLQQYMAEQGTTRELREGEKVQALAEYALILPLVSIRQIAARALLSGHKKGVLEDVGGPLY